MGGMLAQIPINDGLQAHEITTGKIRADELRDIKNDHDRTWIAHPSSTKSPWKFSTSTCRVPTKYARFRYAFPPVGTYLTALSIQYCILREDDNVAAADLINLDSCPR